MYALVDEREGGIVAYFLTEEKAIEVATALNTHAPRVAEDTPAYTVMWMTPFHYNDLLKTIAEDYSPKS